MRARKSQQKFRCGLRQIKAWIPAVTSIVSTIVAATIAINEIHYQSAEDSRLRTEERQKYIDQIALLDDQRKKDYETWLKQHNVEWSRQNQSLQDEKSNEVKAQKFLLYQEFVYHLNRVCVLMDNISNSGWRIYCLNLAEIPMPKRTSSAEIERTQSYLDEQLRHWQDKHEKNIAEFESERLEVVRLMQDIKMKFSTVTIPFIDVGLFQLNNINPVFPKNGETDAFIQKTFLNETNPWVILDDYCKANIRKYVKPEHLEIVWNDVDDMLSREILLDKNSMPVLPEYLTNSGTFFTTNADGLVEKFEPVNTNLLFKQIYSDTDTVAK